MTEYEQVMEKFKKQNIDINGKHILINNNILDGKEIFKATFSKDKKAVCIPIEDEEERYRYLQWKENKETIQLGDFVNVFVKDIKIGCDRNLTRMVLWIILFLTVRKIIRYLFKIRTYI